MATFTMVLPLAHTSAVQQFERYARITGIALDTILSRDLLAVVEEARHRETVSAQAIVDIFQITALAARRPDLGIAFAVWCNLHGYGPLSLLWDHCTSVEHLLRLTGRYLHLESEAIGSHAVTQGDEIAVQQFLRVPTLFGGSQYLETTMTVQLRIMRTILGQQWHPVRMEFAHPAPDQLGFHRSVFRCPLHFGADRTALVLRRDDLERPAPNGNAQMMAYLERQLDMVRRTRPGDDLVAVLERHLVAAMAGGDLGLPAAARALGMSERSLQRALAAAGRRFADVLTEVRIRVASDYFANEPRPNLSDLAYRLGYGEASAASRFLRQNLQAGARLLSRRQRSSRAGVVPRE